jgi:hypothetical protein
MVPCRLIASYEGREYSLEAGKTVQLGYGDVWLFLWILSVDGYSGPE